MIEKNSKIKSKYDHSAHFNVLHIENIDELHFTHEVTVCFDGRFIDIRIDENHFAKWAQNGGLLNWQVITSFGEIIDNEGVCNYWNVIIDHPSFMIENIKEYIISLELIKESHLRAEHETAPVKVC